MFFRNRIALGLAFLLAFVFVVPVFAGGWAVITLDELPIEVVAGEPFKIGFTVLQHGRTPMSGLTPSVTATRLNDEELTFFAESDGEPGHYTATLTFPKEGNWEWSIRAFTMDQVMPALHVSASSAVSADQPVVKTETVPALISPLVIVRTLALVIVLAGLVVLLKRKSRQAVALMGFCLLMGLALFITGAGAASNVEAQSKSSSDVSANSSVSQVELGRQLFIAKGCITCHYNDKAADRSEYWTIEMGAPDLSKFSASPEILFLRLKDPAAAKSDTQMPDLDLEKTEIEALVAFINSK